jgi:hypothetical protein
MNFLEGMINVSVSFIMLLYFYGVIDTVRKFHFIIKFHFF